MSAIRPMGPREWAMLVFLSILWGGSFFYNAVAVTALPVLTIACLRVAIAAAALFMVLKAQGLALPGTREALIAFLGMGFLNNVVPFSLILWAQTLIPGGLAAILNGTTPLFTVLVLHALSADEKATGLKFAGVVIGFAGVAVMIGLDLAGKSAPVLPQLAALGAALSYAFSALWGRRFARLGIPSTVAATGQMTAASLMLLPLALVVEQPWTLALPGLKVWLAVLALALLSTALAYILFFRILEASGATNLMLVTFLIPVSAILLGVLLLDEILHARHFIGMALIGCGLAFIDGRVIRKILGR